MQLKYYGILFCHRSGSVLCVGTAMTGEVCFSADELGEVRIWQLPIEINDPFDSYGMYLAKLLIVVLSFSCT